MWNRNGDDDDVSSRPKTPFCEAPHAGSAYIFYFNFVLNGTVSIDNREDLDLVFFFFYILRGSFFILYIIIILFFCRSNNLQHDPDYPALLRSADDSGGVVTTLTRSYRSWWCERLCVDRGVKTAEIARKTDGVDARLNTNSVLCYHTVLL